MHDYGLGNERGRESVKILKAGDLNRIGNARRFQCEACGCVWEADRSEYHRETDFRNGHYYVCKCPTCERDTISYPEDQQ